MTEGISENEHQLRKQMLTELNPKNHKFEAQKRLIIERCVVSLQTQNDSEKFVK